LLLRFDPKVASMLLHFKSKRCVAIQKVRERNLTVCYAGTVMTSDLNKTHEI